MSRKNLSLSSRVLGTFLVGALALAACGNSGDDDVDAADAPGTTEAAESGSEDSGEGSGEFQAISGVPGVTDDEISFAVLSTGESNPLGYCLLACIEDGVKAYFDWRNSEGGLHGRDLVVSKVVDDELGNNQVKALELTEDSDVFGVFSVPLIASGFADLASARVPVWTNVVAASESAGQETIFQLSGTPCIKCPAMSNLYLPKQAGATTVAAIGYGVSQASKDQVASVIASVEKWGDEAGIELGYTNDDMPYGLPNGIGPEVTAMKEAGVDYVITAFDQGGALALEQELERQGMSDVLVQLPQGYADAEFAAANADLLEGDILSTYVRPLEANPEGTQMEHYLHWMEERGATVTEYSLHGWVMADLAYQGILAAGPQFDREAVIEATNQFTDYTGGGMTAPVDYSRQHNPPTIDDPVTNGPAQRCFGYVAITGGEFELIGDPEKPWTCWDQADGEWHEPTATNFE